METNYNLPAPPFNHISGILLKSSRHVPAVTRVLSRSRERTLRSRLEKDYHRARGCVLSPHSLLIIAVSQRALVSHPREHARVWLLFFIFTISKRRNHYKITKDNFASLCDINNLIVSQMAEADHRYLLVIEFEGRTVSY